MTDRELMQQALDAATEELPKVDERETVFCSIQGHHLRALCEFVRAALTQPEPEPWGYISHKSWKMPVFVEADDLQAANLPHNNPDYTPVYKTPPQREWQDLTDDESDEIWGECLGVFDCLRMTQAKLKEKNT